MSYNYLLFCLSFGILFSHNSAMRTNTFLKSRNMQGEPTCVIVGCNRQLCVEQGSEFDTSCDYEPIYECYQDANCISLDNSCQWEMTEELTNCLQSFSNNETSINDNQDDSSDLEGVINAERVPSVNEAGDLDYDIRPVPVITAGEDNLTDPSFNALEETDNAAAPVFTPTEEHYPEEHHPEYSAHEMEALAEDVEDLREELNN